MRSPLICVAGYGDWRICLHRHDRHWHVLIVRRRRGVVEELRPDGFYRSEGPRDHVVRFAMVRVRPLSDAEQMIATAFHASSLPALAASPWFRPEGVSLMAKSEGVSEDDAVAECLARQLPCVRANRWQVRQIYRRGAERETLALRSVAVHVRDAVRSRAALALDTKQLHAEALALRCLSEVLVERVAVRVPRWPPFVAEEVGGRLLEHCSSFAPVVERQLEVVGDGDTIVRVDADQQRSDKNARLSQRPVDAGRASNAERSRFGG